MGKPITVVSKATGEIFEFLADTDMELAQSYDQIRELQSALERAKTKIKTQILQRMEASSDDSIDLGSYKWKKQIKHYLTYDIEVMKKLLPRDVYDGLVVPNKVKVDEFLKENVKTEVVPNGVAQELRATMYPNKTPSVAVLLEKVKS